MADTLSRVKSIVVNCLEVDAAKVTAEASFVEDLGADSLDTYELLQGLEEEFGISIAEDEAQNFKTVGQVVAYIEKVQK